MLTEDEQFPTRLIGAGFMTNKESRNLAKDYQIAQSIYKSELSPLTPGVITLTRRARRVEAEAVVHTHTEGQAVSVPVPRFRQEPACDAGFEVECASGGTLDIGYSECLWDDKVAVMWQGIANAERILLRKGRTVHKINQPRGFSIWYCGSRARRPRSN